ncbi:hypothetical protein EJ05DRAFT_56976 [Pseudovirgaria hyperparasitica]|uniref:Rab-GAP TBC domain-containing protein n=1 Tax=Pseudovirgaria hyperparasitica TaxID=470096 RepID=A0A6A6W6F6_9PEZI|nr:uncharacterized protein EJ05DRAFT_56976 [Pseudovirgaria hyperparasitica]KAF2757147.1 hypothetical protein EJ05DRAFT_56976 [Pseudovirgaria hyperparasitica]
MPMSILLRDATRITNAYENVLKLMHIKLPTLYTHLFEKLRLHPDEFLGTMFESLMIGRMSVDNACRIWDAMVFEGDRIFTRAAVGILSSLEAQLYTDKNGVLDILGRQAGNGTLLKETPDDFAFMVRAAAKMK